MAFLTKIKNLTGRSISIYADFIDPFCYIGFHQLKALAESRGIQLEWLGFEFNPGTPPEGLNLETAGNSDLRAGMWASVDGLARKAGLEFSEPTWIPNTRAAHLVVDLAKEADVKNPLIERIYQAYFNGHQNIGRLDVLIDLAAVFGLSSDAIRATVLDVRQAARLDRRRLEAERRSFLGMPGFVYRGRNHFGALSREAWEKILI